MFITSLAALEVDSAQKENADTQIEDAGARWHRSVTFWSRHDFRLLQEDCSGELRPAKVRLHTSGPVEDQAFAGLTLDSALSETIKRVTQWD
jgi:hypothetical protein